MKHPKLWDGQLLWKIRTHTGYEAYACLYWNEKTGTISVVEETPEGQQLGSYVNFDTREKNDNTEENKNT